MIEIECDKCEATFPVEDRQAGGKVACPMCGDVNRVPGAAGVPGVPGAAAAGVAAAAPAARSRAEDLPSEEGPEQEICVVRPAMFRAHPFRFLFILILVGGGAAGAIYGWRKDNLVIGYGSLAPALFGLLWWLKWWIAAHMWIKVTITNKRTIRHEGIVRRHSTEVLHDHVRSVDINQNFLQRIMKVGYIGIDSAGQDGIEIEIRDLPGPYEIKALIDRYRTM